MKRNKNKKKDLPNTNIKTIHDNLYESYIGYSDIEDIRLEMYKRYTSIKYIPKISLENVNRIRRGEHISYQLSKYLFNRDFNKVIKFWFDKVESWVINEGSKRTIQRIKYMRILYQKSLSQDKDFGIESLVGINKRNLPKYKLLNDLHDGNKEDKRMLFALLSISRALKLEPEYPSINSITDPYKGNDPIELKDKINRIVKGINLKCNYTPKSEELHISTKQGPNGLAMLTAIRDAKELKDEDLIYIKTLGGSELLEKLNNNKCINADKWEKSLNKTFKSPTKNRIGKLSVITQPEGKNRIIAIVDYWTQAALKPLHELIFSKLKDFESDCTFTQDNPHKWIKEGPFFCYDLSNATDRFPIQFQKIVLECIFNKDYSDAWMNIMRSRKFYCKWLDKDIQYECGQPMGAYSSWAVFALSHHILVRLASLNAKRGMDFTNYALLGDDIVIADEKVAAEYTKLCEFLGVEINKKKSIISKTHFEFAKRFVEFETKTELTGISLQAIIESEGKYHLLANEIRNIFHRFNIDIEKMDPGLIENILAQRNKLYRKRLARKAQDFLLLPSAIYNEEIKKEFLIILAKKVFKNVLSCNHQDEALKLIKLGLAEVKARIIESSILKLKKVGDDSLKNARSYLVGFSGGDAQSVLRSIPVVEATLNQRNKLINDIDNIRDPMETPIDKLIFDKALFTGFDASRLLATRNSQLIQDNNATLLNNLKAWSREYYKIHQYHLSDPNFDENIGRSMMRSILRTKVIGVVMPGFPL